ncbi:Hypothetical predicted protein, partial [Paramuricea clavata]
MADCASTSKDEAAEFESITVETNTSFTNKELISMLNRDLLSKIKPEAEFAAKILTNTLEKEYFKPLRSFRCLDMTKRRHYISWKQLVADTCGTNARQVEAKAKIVYQHILQYFWSFVALKFSATDASSDITGIGVQKMTDCVDEAEKQAIRHHAGWA